MLYDVSGYVTGYSWMGKLPESLIICDVSSSALCIVHDVGTDNSSLGSVLG